MLKRRSFFRGLIAAVAMAPALVRAAEFVAPRCMAEQAWEEFYEWYVRFRMSTPPVFLNSEDKTLGHSITIVIEDEP